MSLRRVCPGARFAGWCVAVWLLAGCGGRYGAADLSVDPELARESFAAFLEAWKAGQTPADLQRRSPPILVGEPEWAAGTRLLSYEITADEFNDGANLHTAAELKLRDANGLESRQRVEYIVGTEPTVTVFRAE